MLASSTSRSAGSVLSRPTRPARCREASSHSWATPCSTTSAGLKTVARRFVGPGHVQLRRDQAVPAVEQVELDRHPVRAVPALVLERRRIGLQAEVVRRDVVDVLLDHDLDQEHDHDVAGGLEQALVVPAGVRGRELAGDPVVLAQEQRVEQHEADLRVRRVAARGEQRVEPLGRDLLGPDTTADLAELRLLDAVLVEVGRELRAADLLRLQPPALRVRGAARSTPG